MRHLAMCLLLPWLACSACGNDALGGADLAAGPSDGGAATVPDMASHDLAVSPWGIETRPPNPSCKAPLRPPSTVGAQFTAAFGQLSFSVPIAMVQAPGDDARWFVVQKGGLVRAFANDEATAVTTPFVDITARVNSGPGEAGLLGIAFHPRWQDNHHVFLSYTAYCPMDRPACRSSRLLSTISRFTSRDGGKTLDPTSEKVLLQLDQPETNHNGGHIAFGHDNLLYAGFGDGGSGGDPHGPIGNGQNTQTMLGKILRIDVNGGDPYAIPRDNPFASGNDGAKEIYAWGMRNPWRFSFDRASGDLWAGDVGQNQWEEIDRVRLGGNYGWRVMEGNHCYMGGCETNGYDLPVVEYGHGEGCSVTGGYVYRGALVPRLAGIYIYGDYCSGRTWALLADEGGRPKPVVIPGGTGMTSYGESNAGELFLIGANGRLYKLVAAMGGADTLPQKLSLTGCVDPANPREPAGGLVPFDVASPLWSDGASKRRWLALPDGARIKVGDDGDFDLPIGAVLVKEFTLAGRRVETRLLVRHADGEWAGYSYRWDEAEGDATLLVGSDTRVVGGQPWYFPSRAECLACHTVAAGRTLGLEIAQLNHVIGYPGGKNANQLATLDHIGLFEDPIGAPATLAALPAPDGDAAVDARARSYLHTNCSFCHRPNSTGRGDADLRFGTPARMMNVCDVEPAEGGLGVAGSRLVAPGDPARSITSLRMHALDADRMPPLASRLVDPTGTRIVDDWIRALGACP